MQYRTPSPAPAPLGAGALANVPVRATAAPPRSLRAVPVRPAHGGSVSIDSPDSRRPVEIALAASLLAILAAAAFIATEDVAVGVLLIVLAWIPVIACCCDRP